MLDLPKMDKSIREEIEEILVDTYGEDEEAAAWGVAFDDGVEVPFSATLLGVPVQVTGFRAADSGAIQCEVVRDKRKRWIGVEELDEEELPEDMAHVLGLYRAWIEGAY